MKSFLILVSTVVLAPAVLAQPQTFAVNPDASTVHMKLNTTHEVVNGIFHLQSGSIDFDRTTSHISGMVIVAADSGKTGNDSRDKKMNNDILRVAQFTTVSFAPKTYSGTIAASGDSTIQVSGVFTLLGTPHDLTIPMQIHIDGSKATAKGQFVVPYVEWGLKNPSFLIWKAENNVAIDLTLVGQILRRHNLPPNVCRFWGSTLNSVPGKSCCSQARKENHYCQTRQYSAITPASSANPPYSPAPDSDHVLWTRKRLNHRTCRNIGRPQPVRATRSDMNHFSKGGVYGTRKTRQAFRGAEDRHMAPLEVGRVVA